MKSFWHHTRNKIKILVAQKWFQIFLVTLGIHLLVVLFFALTNLSIFSNASDHIFYHESATQIAELLHTGTYHIGDVYPHHWFPLFMGAIYFVVGPSMALGAVLNALLVACSAVLFYKILRDVNVSEKIAFWGSLIVLNGYASFVYHSSILLKEAWIVALLLGTVYLSICMVQGKGNRWVIFGILLVLFTLLRSLRFFIGFAAIAGFFIDWIMHAVLPRTKKILVTLVMIGAVVGLGLLLQGKYVIGSVTVTDALGLDFMYNLRWHSSNNGNTATHTSVITKRLPGGKLATPYSLMPENNQGVDYGISIKGLVKSFMTTVIGPFPWQLSLTKYVILLVDTLFVLAVVVITLFGLFRSKWKTWQVVIPWIVITGVIILGVTVGTDNIGAMIRQRIPSTIMLGLLACYFIDYLVRLRTMKGHETVA